jgi:hypothetical protein
MKWAAYRETKRVEDTAYCLMGIFGVNMPLLYGEGDRAFIRLQEEILRCKHHSRSTFLLYLPPLPLSLFFSLSYSFVVGVGFYLTPRQQPTISLCSHGNVP